MSLKAFIGIIILNACILSQVCAQHPVGKDCASARKITSKTTISGTIEIKAAGNKQELPGGEGASCFVKGEKYPFWFTFTAENDGNLEFYLEGSDNTDWDWVIYETESDCNNTRELSCNAAVNVDCSSTGISSQKQQQWEMNPCGDTNPWETDLALKEGKQYILLINCLDCRKGDTFQLSIGGNVKLKGGS